MKKVIHNKWVGTVFCLLLLGFFLTGCATTSQLENLEQRLEQVEGTSNMALEKAEAAEMSADECSMDAEQSAQQAEAAAEEAEMSARKAERMADKCSMIFDKMTSK